MRCLKAFILSCNFSFLQSYEWNALLNQNSSELHSYPTRYENDDYPVRQLLNNRDGKLTTDEIVIKRSKERKRKNKIMADRNNEIEGPRKIDESRISYQRSQVPIQTKYPTTSPTCISSLSISSNILRYFSVLVLIIFYSLSCANKD